MTSARRIGLQCAAAELSRERIRLPITLDSMTEQSNQESLTEPLTDSDNASEASQPTPTPAGPPSGYLVADVADHNPFGERWTDLDVTHVESFLAGTIEDEPLHWEAKAVTVTPDHVRRAVTAFANREGGYLILGAARDEAARTWQLPGLEFPGTEPRTWLSGVIRSSISPPPDFDIHAWDRDGKLKVAVVQIQPNCGALSVSQGRVYYRRPGESSFVEDGAELQSIQNTVQYRSRALPGGARPSTGSPSHSLTADPDTLDIDLERAVAARVLRRCLDDGKDADINIYVAATTSAIAVAYSRGEDDALIEGLDRLIDAAAVMVSFAPESASAERVIDAIHDVFDTGQVRPTSPAQPPRERLWLQILPRARALGALGIRIRHWRPLRRLILHDVSDPQGTRAWPYWFGYGDVMISRERLYYQGNNVLESSRAPLRMSAEQALRLPALRPDAVTDEDALVTSTCEFDLVTNLVCLRDAHGLGRSGYGLYPYFAAWGGDRVRPIAERIIADPACRDALLPEISERELAELLKSLADIADEQSRSLGMWGFSDGFIEGKVGIFMAEYGVYSR